MIVFPYLIPDRIVSLELPNYTSSSKEFRQGDRLFKRTQFTGRGTKLIFQYSMLSQDELDSILLIWDTTEGSGVFTLPQEILDKYPQEFTDAIANLNSTTYWTISEPPIYTPRILSAYNNAPEIERTNRYDLELTLTSEIS